MVIRSAKNAECHKSVILFGSDRVQTDQNHSRQGSGVNLEAFGTSEETVLVGWTVTLQSGVSISIGIISSRANTHVENR